MTLDFPRAYNILCHRGAVSSVVERILHTDEVTGSRPVPPTTPDLTRISTIGAAGLATPEKCAHSLASGVDAYILSLRVLSQRADLGWKVHPHSLRHFCGVSILKQTGNLEVVRQVLGHETLHMALHYSRLASPDVARSYRRASPVDSLTLD